LADTLDEAGELRDVRRDVLLLGDAGLPGSIAANDEAAAPGLVGSSHDDGC
jgi:hypothetical protein